MPSRHPSPRRPRPSPAHLPLPEDAPIRYAWQTDGGLWHLVDDSIGSDWSRAARGLDVLWRLVPKSVAWLALWFVAITMLHDTQPTYVGGVLIGVALLAGLRQLRRGVPWAALRRYW